MTTRVPPATARLALWSGLLLSLLAGCRGGSLPSPANPDRARAALVAALDAWQLGGSGKDLAGRDPPVYFNDPKCRPDVRLVGYTLADGHEPYGQSVRIAAVLSLRLPDGTTGERKVTYLIDTDPAVVIVPG